MYDFEGNTKLIKHMIKNIKLERSHRLTNKLILI